MKKLLISKTTNQYFKFFALSEYQGMHVHSIPTQVITTVVNARPIAPGWIW